MLADDISSEFQNALNDLVGEICDSYVPGFGPSIARLSVKIGDKVLRKISPPPVRGKLVSKYTLLIFCDWRLESEEEVLCGNYSLNEDITSNLDKLIGKIITSVRVSLPSYDLAIKFGDQLTMKIFCNEVEPSETDGNYNLYTPTLIYAVGPLSKLSRESRETVEYISEDNTFTS